MEWIAQILAKHTKEDGTVDVKAANEEIDKAFPEHAVPKDQYNNISNQLTETNKTLKTLEEKTKDNPDIQKELTDLKEKAEKLEAENQDLKISSQVSAALQGAGAKDVDYMKFKLGSVELDKDGKVKDIDSKIKDLQKELPDYFHSESGSGKSGDKGNDSKQGGYKPIDNKLKSQENQTTYTMEEIEKMTPEQINANWEAVSVTLEGGNE